jgi:hypothetical protein
MQPEHNPSPYVVKRPRLGFAIVLAGIAALVLIAFALRPFDAGDGERSGTAPAPAIQRGNTEAIGTSGADAPGGATDMRGAAAPVLIQELDTITGANDGRPLIGRRVDLQVTVRDPNDVAFWAGEGDNRVLVVFGRDSRDGAGRQEGLPSSHGIEPLQAGQAARVSGTIQRLPEAEQMYSWRLTGHDVAELAGRGIYVRADRVTPNGGQ